MASDPYHRYDVLDYDAETKTYRVTYSNVDSSPSMALVDAIGQIEGCEPVDITPLQTIFDPDAFDAVLQYEKDGDRSVRFTFEGYDVLAQSYGVIELKPREDDAPE